MAVLSSCRVGDLVLFEQDDTMVCRCVYPRFSVFFEADNPEAQCDWTGPWDVDEFVRHAETHGELAPA